MKIIRPTMALILMSAALMPANADQYLGKMGSYVKVPTTVEAKIVVLDLTPEVRVLADRVRTNINNNRKWLETYVRGLQPGEAVPYHQNFGISEGEYRSLLTGSKELAPVPVGTATLTFEYREDDTVRISGLPGDAPFDEIIYEPVSDSILCSYGTLTKSEETTGQLGTVNDTAWTGRIWKVKRTEAQDNANIGFVVGKFDTDNTNILIHEVNGRIGDQPVAYHYILMWDAPAP